MAGPTTIHGLTELFERCRTSSGELVPPQHVRAVLDALRDMARGSGLQIHTTTLRGLHKPDVEHVLTIHYERSYIE